MNTKNLVLMAMLVATGTALYLVIPGFGGGMKLDFMLTMMIIGILLFPDVKSVFLLAASTGVLSGIFSTFPAGFIPNIIDKPITAFAVFGVVLLLKKLANHLVVGTLLTALGTILSGTIFLSVAFFVMGTEIPGLESPFIPLFLTVVLPTAALNAGVFFITKPIVNTLVKKSAYKTALSQ